MYTFSECPNIAVWLVVPCRMPGFDDRPRESPPDPAPGSWSTGSAGATGPGRLKTLASSMMWPRIGGRTGSRIGGRVGDRVGHPATATHPAHSRCSDTRRASPGAPRQICGGPGGASPSSQVASTNINPCGPLPHSSHYLPFPAFSILLIGIAPPPASIRRGRCCASGAFRQCGRADECAFPAGNGRKGSAARRLKHSRKES